jgi:hypothetical protein
MRLNRPWLIAFLLFWDAHLMKNGGRAPAS